MTENVDTYVLPEESDRFLAEVLPASDPLRITWEVLSDEDKEGYLSSARRNIEALSFVGDKVWYYQPLKFPRAARGIPVNFDKAPMEVKRAQVYWAAVIAKNELYVKRRNNDACLSLGLIGGEVQNTESVPRRVSELLHRWITNLRRI